MVLTPQMFRVDPADLVKAPSIVDNFRKEALRFMYREMEARIVLFRECGVEIERFSFIHLDNGTVHLCIDGMPRVSWQPPYYSVTPR